MSVVNCNVRIMFRFLLHRKEHTSHSPSCSFISLKKDVKQLTVEEFLKLQKDQQKFLIVSGWDHPVMSGWL